MNRNFDTDNFERLLKEKADEFNMYPSKRVWYSIYNNIHPGKRWPSIATSIALISILLLIGFLNTNHNDTSFDFTINKTAGLIKHSPVSLNHPFLYRFITSLPGKNNSTNATDIIVSLKQTIPLISTNTHSLLLPSTPIVNIHPTKNIITGTQKTFFDFAFLKTKINTSLLPDNYFPIPAIEAKNKFLPKREFIPETELVLSKLNQSLVTKTPSIDESTLRENNIFSIAAQSNKKEHTHILHLTTTDKGWIENYALYNRPEPKKWAGKLSRQLYLTPSIVFRDLTDVAVTNTTDVNKTVTQKPSVGIEIGAGIVYTIFKSVKLKTSLQLNATRYNTEAYENAHPVASSIGFMPDASMPSYQEVRATPFSNYFGISPVKLHNETFQISLPVGIDFKLAGTDNLQWWVGGTIQPTYVIGGKSYLLSADNRYFIKASDLLNRWNLNAGFETYFSYKTNGYTIQVGPQFRKQLFTTNTNKYTIHERLNNYGIKVGISKLIK